MVLTAEELNLAADKGHQDGRIFSALYTRRTTNSFLEQAACDREIQRYLQKKGSMAYKFNCCVIHQPWKYKQVRPFADHGWNNDGPTNEKLMNIYRSLPIYDKNGNAKNSEFDEEKFKLNDLNNTGIEGIDKIILDEGSLKSDYSKPPDYNALRKDAASYPDINEKPGCFTNFLSCIFV